MDMSERNASKSVYMQQMLSKTVRGERPRPWLRYMDTIRRDMRVMEEKDVQDWGKVAKGNSRGHPLRMIWPAIAIVNTIYSRWESCISLGVDYSSNIYPCYYWLYAPVLWCRSLRRVAPTTRHPPSLSRDSCPRPPPSRGPPVSQTCPLRHSLPPHCTPAGTGSRNP